MIVRPAIARGVGALSRRSGRGGGTTLPGRLLLKMAPGALAALGAKLNRGSTIISATNGKTTTASMLAGALRAAGRVPVHNRAGSNMSWGVVTSLLEQQGDEGLFEVDEAWLPRVASELDARLLILGNLFRDQLDRYGELEHLADEWAELVERRGSRTRLVLNADDPLIADLGRTRDGAARPGVLYFGIEDDSQALPSLAHAHDAKHCRRCGEPYHYRRSFLGHLGHYACPNGDGDRPRPEIAATAVERLGMTGSRLTISTPQGGLELTLPLPGLYNVYNALAAVAGALALGVGLERIKAGLESTKAVFGRVETIEISDRPVSILLIKNPIGANEVLRTLAPLEGLDLWIALNDGIADGRDVSWIWDADFEQLADRVGSVTCSGTRAPELANRLKYAGWPTDRISIDDSIHASFDAAVASSSGPLYALPTYTALIELRTMLSERGLAAEFWR